MATPKQGKLEEESVNKLDFTKCELDYILQNAEKKGKEKTPYVKPKLVYEGDRDNQVFKYLNDLYYKTRLDYDEINVLAHYFNENILDEPFDDKTIDYKVKKLFEKKRPKYIHILLPDNE